jgi:acyl dehydratase
MRPQPRERFWSEIQLSPAIVSQYATAAGDTNPVHHDPEFAATTRYGRPIASGTQTTALLLGLTELGPEQRLAALIIVHEGMAR